MSVPKSLPKPLRRLFPDSTLLQSTVSPRSLQGSSLILLPITCSSYGFPHPHPAPGSVLWTHKDTTTTDHKESTEKQHPTPRESSYTKKQAFKDDLITSTHSERKHDLFCIREQLMVGSIQGMLSRDTVCEKRVISLPLWSTGAQSHQGRQAPGIKRSNHTQVSC